MRWHIWALVALTGMAGLVATAGTVHAQTDPKTVVATVNGHTITLGEVNTVLEARGVDTKRLPPDKVNQARFEAASLLADGHLWEDYLKKYGPRIDSAEVKKHLAELEAEVKKHGKSMADYYKESGTTEASVRAGIQSILQWEALARTKVPDSELRHYYDQNKDYFDRVIVRASHIVLRVPTTAPAAEQQAARDKLLAIRAHIVAGKLDFAEAARRYSQDATAVQGGELGLLRLKFYLPDERLARAAFALPVNGVSDVVQAEDGLHLILVTERKPPERPSEFEKVEDEVRNVCTTELQMAVMQQLRKEAKIKITLPN